MAAEKTPVRDYAADIEADPPQYLREWAAKGTRKRELMLYKAGWYVDPITDLREQVADCRCTACGAEMKLSKISGYVCGGYASEMGFRDMEGMDCRSGTVTKCPDCGAKVTAEHLKGEHRRYGEEWAYPVTLQRIDGWGETDRLALVEWEVCCWYSWEGTRHETIRLYEAAVAEESRLLWVTAHAKTMNGNDYSIPPRQLSKVTERMQGIDDIVVPDWSIIEGTTCENAKLEIYLREKCRPLFPAAYLKLWQTKPQVETLLTCGAGNLLNALIAEEKARKGVYSTAPWNCTFPKLGGLNWKARRPADILRMNGRGELREAIGFQEKNHLSGSTWCVWLSARAAGLPWTLEDAAAVEETGISGPMTEARPALLAKYLRTQKRRHPEGKADLRLWRDYRNLREAVPEELRGPEWPENLRREHDLAVVRQKVEVHKEMEKGFRKRARELQKYRWEKDGILIRPPEDEAELIREGKVLEHCVATYAKKHAEGETVILFIRHADDPEMPWYTLNLDEKTGTVIQNRGKKNCPRTREIEKFEKEWLRWVHEGCRRKKEEKTA